MEDLLSKVAINIAINLPVAIGWAFAARYAFSKTASDAKEIKDTNEADPFLEEVMKIGDIHISKVSPRLRSALIGLHTYLDTKPSLREHLYCAATIIDDNSSAHKDDKLDEGLIDELKMICKHLDAKDCAYFRIIS